MKTCHEKAEPYLNKDSLLALYFPYIHSYINYANLVWGSTHRTYSRKINSKTKTYFKMPSLPEKFEQPSHLYPIRF